MSTVLGLDIGTTSICGVAVSEAGELIASVERPNDSAVVGLPAGRMEQNPAKIRERAFEVLRELGSRVEKVSCIGLTGQMHGMLCVDSTGKPLSNLITWQDQRCLEVDNQGVTYLERIRERVSADQWASCGCEPASGFMGSTLFWMCRNNAVPAGTQRISFIHDWIGGQLTGQLPVTDPSDAGSAGLFDLSRMQWHTKIVQSLELPAGLLPPVQESGEIIGRISVEAAGATGIAAGTPIGNALGDNQASVLGSIAEIDKSILVNLGTGGQISWSVPSFCRVSGMETRYLPRRRYMLVGASLCGGRAYAWLNDVVRDWLKPFGVTVDRETVYAKLNELANAARPGAGKLTARTTFAGKRIDPSLRGSFEGVALDNFSLANVSRAVLEGLVEELCELYDRSGHGGERSMHEWVVASGNTVRKNQLLRGIISARMGRRVLIPQHREEAAFGSALAAGVGAGIWADLNEAGRCVRYAC